MAWQYSSSLGVGPSHEPAISTLSRSGVGETPEELLESLNKILTMISGDNARIQAAMSAVYDYYLVSVESERASRAVLERPRDRIHKNDWPGPAGLSFQSRPGQGPEAESPKKVL